MDGFDHILNWTLQLGSHPFPGKDGGTCINEAAIVAAGFAYQPVPRVEDMPECFSRPICRLAMWLNDEATDEERQQLLPFVTRLAFADIPEVERARAAYIQARLLHPFTFQERCEHHVRLRVTATSDRHRRPAMFCSPGSESLSCPRSPVTPL